MNPWKLHTYKEKLFDSIVGFDTEGNSADTALPPKRNMVYKYNWQYATPRLDALKILLKYTNDPIAQHRIVDEKDISKLLLLMPQSSSGKYDKKVDDFDDPAKLNKWFIPSNRYSSMVDLTHYNWQSWYGYELKK